MKKTLEFGEALRLPALLVGAYAASGQQSVAVMPTGRASDAQEALTRAVVDLGFRDEFVRDLEAAFRAFEVDPTLPRLAEVSTPDEQLITHGFDGMSDQQLAAIAIDPHMIEAVAGVILEDANSDFAPVRPGEWLREARKRWGKTPQSLTERLAEAVD